MDFILLIGWIILGSALFAVLHKILNITYFGFSGMFSVWFGCMAAVAIGFYLAGSLVMYLVSFVVGFVTSYYKWLIGGGVLLVVLAIFGSKPEDKSVKTEHNAN